MLFLCYSFTLYFLLVHSLSLRQTHFLPSPPNPPLYDHLLVSARWSALAYCPSYTIKYWKCGSLCNSQYYKLDLLFYDQELISGSAVYVGYHEPSDTIVISYRGSRNIQNWINNANANLFSVKGWEGKVHEGFYSIYKALHNKMFDQISHLLQVNRHNQSKLLVTGHSLGGALSTYFTLDLMLELNQSDTFKGKHFDISLNTFGSPRVGDGQFSDYFYNVLYEYNSGHLNNQTQQFNLLRVVNKNDLVPHVPELDRGFVHIPHEIWVPTEPDPKVYHQLVECDDVPYPLDSLKSYAGYKEDPKCAYQTRLWNLKDHLRFGNVTFGLPCI